MISWFQGKQLSKPRWWKVQMDREVARNWPLQGCTNNSSTLLSLRHHCIKIVHYQRNTGCMWRWDGMRAVSGIRTPQPPECGQHISAHLPGPCRLGLLGSSDRSDKNFLPWFPNPATRMYCLVSSSALKEKSWGECTLVQTFWKMCCITYQLFSNSHTLWYQ